MTCAVRSIYTGRRCNQGTDIVIGIHCGACGMVEHIAICAEHYDERDDLRCSTCHQYELSYSEPVQT